MIRGPRVVLAILGGVAAVTLTVLAAFLLTADEPLRCVEGELQDNPRRADGSVLPRVETFTTLAEAEAFICRRIPHPRDTADLRLSGVRVARERGLGETIEGRGGADVEVEYADGPRRLLFGAAFPQSALPHGAPYEPLEVQGHPAVLERRAGEVFVHWNRGAFSLSGTARLDAGFDLAALLAVLESVR